jgi:hypothetical protein
MSSSNADCMNMLLEAFHLQDCSKEFIEVLHNSNGFIGGSTALSWFLAMNGWPAVIHEDQDMDIFIRMPKGMPTLGIYYDLVCTTYDLLLRSAGYSRQSAYERITELARLRAMRALRASTDEMDYQQSHIFRVQNFFHSSGRKIQVVFVQPGHNFLDILGKADLNLSKFGIFPDHPSVNTMMLETYAVNRKERDEIVEGYFRLSNVNNNFATSTIARIEKYYDRNFVMIGDPWCESCGHAAMRDRDLTKRQAVAYAEMEFKKDSVARRRIAAAAATAATAAATAAGAAAPAAATRPRKLVQRRALMPPPVSNPIVRANSAFAPDTARDDDESVDGEIIIPCVPARLSTAPCWSAPYSTPPAKATLSTPPPIVRTLSYAPKPSIDTDSDTETDEV